MFSSFLGTYYMGMLITLALLFALISDLFLLPVLILRFYGKGRGKWMKVKEVKTDQLS
jgi:hypothetical protein